MVEDKKIFLKDYSHWKLVSFFLLNLHFSCCYFTRICLWRELLLNKISTIFISLPISLMTVWICPEIWSFIIVRCKRLPNISTTLILVSTQLQFKNVSVKICDNFLSSTTNFDWKRRFKTLNFLFVGSNKFVWFTTQEL